MENKVQNNDQQILISGRSSLTVDKVLHIVFFDEQTLSVDTECGRIVVEGEELKLTSLDKENGRIILNGRINGAFYSEERIIRHGLGKLFK